MLTCKQVSRALHEQDYRDLRPLARLGLWLHVSLCVVCGRANRQIMVFQDGVRTFLHREERGGASDAHLSPAARERMKTALGAPH
jgi:hypothetical protein